MQDTLQYINLYFMILDIFIHCSSAQFPFDVTTQIMTTIFVKHVAEKSQLSAFSLLSSLTTF
jgi:hypothetical protein